jgi:hypothetical protein
MSCDFVGYRLRSLAARIRAKAIVDAPFLFPLLDLPHELIALIVECVAEEDDEDIISLSTTCRFLQNLAEVHIYNYFQLRDSKQMSRLARALSRQKDRFPHVRALKMFCDGFVSSRSAVPLSYPVQLRAVSNLLRLYTEPHDKAFPLWWTSSRALKDCAC